MPVYTVHQPPLRRDETESDPARIAFVRDGFSFWAFLLGPLWMLARRLWLVLLGYCVLAAAIHFALLAIAATPGVRITVSLLLAILVGLEASSLRRWTLRRRGWTDIGVVVADDLHIAGRRFCAGWAAGAGHPCAGPAGRAAGAPAVGTGFAPRDRAVPATGRAAVTVAIVDYGSGNLHSAAKAFERAARESGHEQPIVVTRDPDAVRNA